MDANGFPFSTISPVCIKENILTFHLILKNITKGSKIFDVLKICFKKYPKYSIIKEIPRKSKTCFQK